MTVTLTYASMCTCAGLPPVLSTAGDRVFGLAPGCLGHVVHAPAELLAPMPASLSFEAAATTPTVYITVLTAFRQGHRWKPGSKVRGLSRLCCDRKIASLPASLSVWPAWHSMWMGMLMATHYDYHQVLTAETAGTCARCNWRDRSSSHPSGTCTGLPSAGVCWGTCQAYSTALPGGRSYC